jgi:dinuclear metal center YbgI/SA1388 family protein
MTFYELYRKLSILYPDDLKCEWDNDGIMCSYDLNAQVNNVLVALDVTMETINYAINNNFDTIISHHPLVFRSQKGLTSENYTQKKLINLVKSNINVMSFHTRLDATDGGVNDVLTAALKLVNVVKDELDPIGRIGETPEKISLSTFAENVKNAINSPLVLYSGANPVKKIYVVGGDGKDLIQNAISCGADTLLTGRASYNTMIDASDMGINIVEAGHFFTENLVCQKIRNDVLNFDSALNVQLYNSFNIGIIS